MGKTFVKIKEIASIIVNKAKRQTIEACMKKGEWRIGLDNQAFF
jgi:hypothetical protein